MDKVYYTWFEFSEDIEKIVAAIKDRSLELNGVYGVPRGGLILATCLSYRLDIPLIYGGITKKTLVCDDVSDTGNTLRPFYGRCPIVTIHYNYNSKVTPLIWIREKKEGTWIVYPWEESSPK